MIITGKQLVLVGVKVVYNFILVGSIILLGISNYHLQQNNAVHLQNEAVLAKVIDSMGKELLLVENVLADIAGGGNKSPTDHSKSGIVNL